MTDVAHEPACIDQLSARVRELARDVDRLEADRRHLLSPAEVTQLETRLSLKRQQLRAAETELDELAAYLRQAAGEERARHESGRAAARSGLLRRRRRLADRLQQQLLELERLAPELVDTVAAAFAVDAELRDVEHELGDRATGSSASGWPLAIRNRLGFLLCSDTSPLGPLERPLGSGGREPLATVEKCTICAHAQRAEIEASTESLRALANRYRVGRSAIARHRKNHLGG